MTALPTLSVDIATWTDDFEPIFPGLVMLVNVGTVDGEPKQFGYGFGGEDGHHTEWGRL